MNGAEKKDTEIRNDVKFALRPTTPSLFIESITPPSLRSFSGIDSSKKNVVIRHNAAIAASTKNTVLQVET